MSEITPLNANFAVTGALESKDFEALAKLGYRAVISNRPDGETCDQLTAEDAARAAKAVGIAYFHVPATKYDVLTDPVIEGVARVLESVDGPILAHCASGQRSAIIWAAARARLTPVDEVLTTLRTAGFKLDFLRDDLDAQADRARWLQPHIEPPVLPAGQFNETQRAA